MSLEELKNKHAEELAEMRTTFAGREDDDIILLRYLISRGMDVPKATQALETTLVWREEMGVAEIRKKAAVCTQFEYPHADLVYAHWPHAIEHGVDKNGNPLTLERTGLTDSAGLVKYVSYERFLEYHLHHMEYTAVRIDQMSRERGRLVNVCQVMDLHGLGMKHINGTTMKMLKLVLNVSQDHYPETLDRCIVVNSPFVFNVIWKIVRPMLNERTLSKLTILGKDYHEVLHSHVDIAQLPEWLGGSCDSCAEGCVKTVPYDSGLEKVNIKRSSCLDYDPVPVVKETTVSWQFLPQGNDIGFEVIFQDKDGDKSIVQKNEKHSEEHSGTFTAPSPGMVLLRWDNSYSRFTSKTIEYRVDVYTANDREE